MGFRVCLTVKRAAAPASPGNQDSAVIAGDDRLAVEPAGRKFGDERVSAAVVGPTRFAVCAVILVDGVRGAGRQSGEVVGALLRE
jgi:hypothetical protein